MRGGVCPFILHAAKSRQLSFRAVFARNLPLPKSENFLPHTTRFRNDKMLVNRLQLISKSLLHSARRSGLVLSLPAWRRTGENRMGGLVHRFLSFTARVGVDPHDSHDLQVQKSILVAASSMFIPAGAAWGMMYFALGEYLAGAIPFGYAVFSTISVIAFARKHNFSL